MGTVIASNKIAATEKSAHTPVSMAVSVCLTPGVVAGAPGPIPYPVMPSGGQISYQKVGSATKAAPADASQLRGQLNLLHLQITSCQGVNASQWLGLLNGYAQVASALYNVVKAVP